MLSPSGTHQKALAYFIRMANYTSYLLDKRLEKRNDALTDLQETALNGDIAVLKKAINVATEFSVVLHYRTQINKYLTRKLPDSHWLEWTKIYWFTREFLLFELLLRRSKKGIRKNLTQLLIDSNDLLGSQTYPNIKEIVDNSFENLNKVISTGGMHEASGAHSAELKHKIANFFREIKYPVQTLLFLIAAYCSLFGIPFFITFSLEFSIPAFTFVFYSWWFYSKPNLDSLDVSWSKGIKEVAERLVKSIENTIQKARGTDRQGLSSAGANLAQIVTAPNKGSTNTPDSTGDQSSVSIGRKGGVDYTKTRNSIQFKGDGSESSLNSNSSILNTNLTSLSSFKGFNFEVIQYKPILNPVEFFLGSNIDNRKSLLS